MAGDCWRFAPYSASLGNSHKPTSKMRASVLTGAPSYTENARGSRRRFSFSALRLTVTEENHNISQEYDLRTLSPSSQNIVQIRFDLVRRCAYCACLSLVVGISIKSMGFAYAGALLWVFVVLGLLFVKSGLSWLMKKEEAETFRTINGEIAFEIYSDSPGDAEFKEFISALRAAIARNEPKREESTSHPKHEANQ